MRTVRNGAEWFGSLEEALAHAQAAAASECRRRVPHRPAYAKILRTGAVALAGWFVLQHLGSLALGASKRSSRHGSWSSLAEWS
jgi:hypothetical protein